MDFSRNPPPGKKKSNLKECARFESLNHKGHEGTRRKSSEWAKPSCTFYRLSYKALGSGLRDRAAKRSDQRIRPVACITTNSVMIAITVIESPVNPRQKKA